MRQSRLFAQTYREAPAEADAVSHRLLLRAGFIRQLAAGVYAYLPLGRRVLRKLEGIVREEMDRAGAQELLMPAMQPAELWRESGRYSAYGPELMRLSDRHDREFALGPTHEEVVTALAREEIHSYRKLPVTVYQIQTKFRDERRPRFGLMRGREFLMKDAYSFDTDLAGLEQSYRAMYAAYERIFARSGLDVRAVEADAGTIGGEGGTHEFVALADIGEDTIVSCSHCGYAANLEKADAGVSEVAGTKTGQSAPMPERLHTPNVRTIEELANFLSVPPSGLLKTLIYEADGKIVAVLVRGDREVNEAKFQAFLGVAELAIADADAVVRTTGAPVGFAGPIGLNAPIFADREIAEGSGWIAGANERDYHVRGVAPGRDFLVEATGDFRNAAEEERCIRCGEGTYRFHKGIEVGHVFKLGTKYSERLNAAYLDGEGRKRPLVMGCYGIGVSRMLAAAVEQNNDEAGIVWPMSIAPFRVHLVPVSMQDDAQRELAEILYERFLSAGIDALIDDRDERAGVKFKDSDLIGVPIRIVVGKQAGQGVVEMKLRDGSGNMEVTAEVAYAAVLDRIRNQERANEFL
ncbi:proline--tRNA ligase [Cohnella sp. CIP 111063]|uniref:proline--tRNA ligase n=1 Tax=unclassified Cohnella TaxID=2636738 RepID=UPI000B8C1A79|nr:MULTISPECIES: proline--tRNA ligase [unclassified Cohnella]OXS62606.1 proline--tRNA ligase [Cohnella sp. CIP 111063]PRX74862.1 prolyl-tRNA synthetase [Cohnella sp. SGD-V74]